uniref:Uncharacterized protein n=1 Tax=Megaselia scalaris TaxID=36166 RepID=T1GSF8_MEGSC
MIWFRKLERTEKYAEELRIPSWKLTARNQTSDGTSRQEQGILENNILKIDGSYQYIGDDGQVYEVHYIADEKGFQPQGKHILNK